MLGICRESFFGVVFLDEGDECLIEYAHIGEGHFAGAFALVVNEVYLGEVDVFEASLLYAVRKVYILAVHKVIFIERATGNIHSRPTHQHAATRKDIDLGYLPLGHMYCIVLVDVGRIRK